MALPWSENVVWLSIHGEVATPREVERLASELMDARAEAARWRECAAELAGALRLVFTTGNTSQAGVAALARFDAMEKSNPKGDRACPFSAT